LEFYSPLKNKNGSAETPSSAAPSSDNGTPANNAADTTFDTNAPKFIRPTPAVVSSGHRSVNPQRPNHRGVDFRDSAGTPVKASASGTVSIVVTGCTVGDRGCGGRYGNWIEINHGGGWATRYAHLSSINVQKGVTVKQGQEIGKVGNTGDSTGDHLHFEIRKNGADLNPLKYVPAK
jgi:murein DD-endopeptidase MepM/ murein hydrolase activator NlpD